MPYTDAMDDASTKKFKGGRFYKFTLRDGSVLTEFVSLDTPVKERMSVLNAIAVEPASIEDTSGFGDPTP